MLGICLLSVYKLGRNYFQTFADLRMNAVSPSLDHECLETGSLRVLIIITFDKPYYNDHI